VKKAMTLHGPRYIQIDTPCPSVWNFPSHLTLEVGRLGVKCGLVPLFEMMDGKITKVKKLRGKVPVIEYLQQQKRFQHLVVKEAPKESVTAIQAQADRNIEKYKLMG
jgi:pyruvate ferredoxin oxidoreductase beta subunit